MCRFMKTESEDKDYLSKEQQEREERINSIRMKCYFIELFTYFSVKKLIGSTRTYSREITEKDFINCLNPELLLKCNVSR